MEESESKEANFCLTALGASWTCWAPHVHDFAHAFQTKSQAIESIHLITNRRKSAKGNKMARMKEMAGWNEHERGEKSSIEMEFPRQLQIQLENQSSTRRIMPQAFQK